MSAPAYLFKIEIDNIKPKIWREFFVPSDISLADFHRVIQNVMGWHNYHMYEFEIHEERYQEYSDPEFPVNEALAYKLIDLVPARARTIYYTYDFGDSWEHTIKLVKANFSPPDGFSNGYGCLGGARACPPEDIGGPYGYPDFLEAISDPEHPEHDEIKEWYADVFKTKNPFDSEHFDIKAVNKLLAKIKPQKPRKKAARSKSAQ